MDINFITIIVLLIFGSCVHQSVRIISSQKGIHLKSVLNITASVLLVIGMGGFLASFASTQILQLFSDPVEWPVGNADGALQFPSGEIVVPHEPSGRVQVYDEDYRFLKGWSVNAGGGSFILASAGDNSFFVYTVRGGNQLKYNLSGTLLSSKKYSGAYPEDNRDSISVSVPTPLYLLPLTSPFIAWGIGALGGLILLFTGEAKKISRKRNH